MRQNRRFCHWVIGVWLLFAVSDGSTIKRVFAIDPFDLFPDCPSYSYDVDSASGPSHWGDLCPEYAVCASGMKQSPIALPDVQYTYPFFDIDPERYLANGYHIGLRPLDFSRWSPATAE